MNLKKISNLDLSMMFDISIANSVLKEKIRNELILRNKSNIRYSLEYFYSVCNVGKKALTVYFFPTSKSFETYGSQIIIDTIYIDTELHQVHNNYSATPVIRSYGYQKARYLVNNNVTGEQVKLLGTVGFDVKDAMYCSFE